ncbi:MAG: GIY-YIG nuclease family protein [Candidatus Omnitrophota bacterium]
MITPETLKRCIIAIKKKEPWFVYIVECSDKTLYIGMTNDLDKRIKAHNTTNASRYTRARRPVKLKYFEKSKNRSAALKREAALKKYTRAEKLELIKKLALAEDII